MSQYIIVLTEGTLTSENRAKSITRELYNITRPLAIQNDNEKQSTVFPILEHPDGVQFALEVQTAYTIKVHEQATLEKLVSLFPELTADERFALQSYALNSDDFPFAAIIPSTTTVRDQQYMIDNGWFESDEI